MALRQEWQVMSYFCLDEAVPRQQLYKSSMEIGEKFLRLTGTFARKLNVVSAKVEWQRKQHVSDQATIERLQTELAQLQQSLKPPASEITDEEMLQVLEEGVAEVLEEGGEDVAGRV
ncbi:uncharacterized protein AB9X84_021881 [Acanthopagrus schlegelii]